MMFFTGKKNITGKTSLFLQRKRNYSGVMGNGFVILKRPMMQNLLSTVLNPLNFLPGNAVADTKESEKNYFLFNNFIIKCVSPS